MKRISFLLLLCCMIGGISAQTFYDYTVKSIEGEDFSLASLQGKKVMIVNVASKCGLTSQYEQLEELYKRYKEKDFVIIAFPANNFKGQEPGSDEEIKNFCQLNYGVTFPVMSKISVAGEDIHPLYQWLIVGGNSTNEAEPVDWNFHKYLISEDGRFVRSIPARTSPLALEIIQWIEE